MEQKLSVKVQKLHPDAILPVYASAGAACFDLHVLRAGEVGAFSSAVFDTGLAFEIPEGWVMKVYSRSGHGFKSDVRLSNSVGIIDADYRGPLRVKLRNDSPLRFEVRAGDRIAQAMLVRVEPIELELVEALSETARGAGGYGSTGR